MATPAHPFAQGWQASLGPGATPLEGGVWIFNHTLTQDRSKRLLTSATSPNSGSTCALDELLTEAAQSSKRHRGHGSTAQRRFDKVLVTLNQHAPVFDVFAQAHANITCLVWGSMRFLIGVAVRDITTTEKISEALVDITEHLGRWCSWIELFKESSRIRDRAAHLFSQIINFLIRARLHFGKNRKTRQFKAGFTTYPQKLDEIMSLVRRHGSDLEREAALAAEIMESEHRQQEREEISTQAHYRNETLTQLTMMETKLGRLETHLQTSRSVIKWLQQLQPLQPEIPKAEEGTCRWIFNDPSYIEWKAAPANSLLWIHAGPGFGKSVMAAHIAKSALTSITASHHFQRNVDEDRSNPATFTASILCQILQLEVVKSCAQYIQAINQVAALLELPKENGKTEFLFQKLWSILKPLTTDLPPFTIVVDGVDECQPEFRIELCLQLLELSRQSNASVVVLSRHIIELERQFSQCVIIQVTPDKLTNDILRYVAAEIKRHPIQLHRLEGKIFHKVSSACDGLFIWAAIILKELKLADSYEKQVNLLENCSPGMNSFYDDICMHKTTEFTGSDLRYRREMLLAMLQANRALSSAELSALLTLRVANTVSVEFEVSNISEEMLLRLGAPLVSSTRNHLHLYHESVRNYLTQPANDCPTIRITTSESDEYLARKSLATLSQKEYRSITKVALLLRRNISETACEGEDHNFYEYAATHWYIHVTALKSPKQELIGQVDEFLHRNEFASWSEFILHLSSSQGLILEVQSKLRIWCSGLDDELKSRLVLGDYFSAPYHSAADQFSQNGGDKTLPYLALFQLGKFYNLSSRNEEAFSVKKTVAEGLVHLLGERHPLSLMAQSAFAGEYLSQHRYREAEMFYGYLFKIQTEVLGEDHPDCFQSLQRQGMAQLWMTKFLESEINLEKSMAGFLKTIGPQSFLYLLSEQTLGCVLEAKGDWERATSKYEHVWSYRVSILGPDNPMAVWSRCAMVSSYRKLGRFDNAAKAVNEVIDSRNRLIGRNAFGSVDAVIQRIVLCRENGMPDEAMELIDLICDGDLANPWFERVCQLDHVRALLEFDAGDIDASRETLQYIVNRSSEEGNAGRNRSMLWIRLDFATILRKQNRDEEVPVLFDGIVIPVDCETTDSWEVVSSPQVLSIAEQALRLIRDIKLEDAAALLESNGLQWAREEDLWILTGGPAADTGCMKRP